MHTGLPNPVRTGLLGWTVLKTPPASSANNQAAAGWPDVMEGLVNSSVIIDEHRALMGAVLLGVRSIHT